MRRIGIFGGSFDPIHMAHLILAECCREALELEQVLFIPAFISPLKQDSLPIDSKHRVEMIRLAIGGNSAFRIDTRELDRGGVSYTIDTVQELKREYPNAELVLLMGADSVQDLPKWKSPEELLELISIGAISRGGLGDPPWEAIRGLVSEERWLQLQKRIDAPQLELSSSTLRQRIASGHSIRYQVPTSVEMYIQQHQLYFNAAKQYSRRL
ncbi:nicotinate (nicotinamide) nucleotide adenylyltransferase [Pirellulaceae bacterium SH467]|jgi:nicotinate-nucleotide adenylyltransferase